MSQQHVNLQNLSEGSQDSLRALIQAIIPDAAIPSNANSKGDAIAKLTEKLAEILGPETTEGMKQSHNERGELVNEEGLPIFDITEPVDLQTHSMPPPVTVEPLLPLASLPLPVRERLRERRNRILDLLEEEERQTELLEKERDLQERAEMLRKRKEEAARQKDGLREARELQKKMGRALLQNMGQARMKEEREREAQRLQDEQKDRHRSPSNKKKSVTFAERPESYANVQPDESSVDTQWGDITPARLQNVKRPTLASQSLLDKHPMKMSVVERVPGGQTTLPRAPQSIINNLPDSDDESDPEHMSDSSDNTPEEDDPILEEDDVDFDFAQQQREIAMEYYRKRNIIGQEAASAMLIQPHETDDASIEGSQKGSKPVLSQFRASKLAAAYGASTPGGTDSVSLGASVLPASSTRTLQRAIKIGKLDSDGHLVGPEDNSASEDEEPGMQEVLELLQKGEVYNLGPNGEYIHAVRPSPRPSTSESHPDHPRQASTLPPPSRRSGPSKFKASVTASGRAAASRKGPTVASQGSQVDEAPSPSMTPISHQHRSSPKLDESSETHTTNPVAEAVYLSNPTKPQAPYSPPFSMIIDSPSFPIPEGHSRRPERPPAVLSAKVYESKRQTTSASAPSSENNSSDMSPPKKVSRFKAERI